ncbi:hypothetical protein B0I35DRAFT_517352 [Stachybotrys elegans]|uniref:Fungal N-terminal domain-containing protein n=1 Tax=Stachybotrys elegans TaxID=80388 RepID=A0A8K0S8E6_9HYPO|nr:hypothetical protein B0I35DRAFT_517352 [Stachybotrys elegans]
MEGLGAAAAVFQLTGLSFKVFRFVQDLNDVPDRLTSLLQQLGMEIDSANRILRADSHVFNKLTATQYAHLSGPAIEARKAAMDLHLKVEPFVQFFDGQAASRSPKRVIKNTKKRLAALFSEKDIEDKIRVVERLNQILLRELHLAGFETQAFLRHEIQMIRDTQVASSNSNREGISCLNDTADRTRDSIQVLRSSVDIAQLAIEHVEKEIAHTGQGITSHFELFNNKLNDVVRSQQISRQQNYELIEQGALLPEIYRQLETLTMRQAQTGPVHVVDTLESTFRVDTDRGTASLRTSHYRQDPATGVAYIARNGSRPRPQICTCHWTREPRRSWKLLGSRQLQVHTGVDRDCAIHGKQQTWGFFVEIKLNPLIHGTLGLSLGWLGGKTGWNMTSPMSFRVVMPRSQCPTLQVFDSFFRSVAQLNTSTDGSPQGPVTTLGYNQSRGVPPELWNFTPLNISRHDLLYELRKLCSEFEETLEAGVTSGCDRDENGWSILSEFAHICHFLYGSWRPLFDGKADLEITEVLSRLAQLTLCTEVDPMDIPILPQIDWENLKKDPPTLEYDWTYPYLLERWTPLSILYNTQFLHLISSSQPIRNLFSKYQESLILEHDYPWGERRSMSKDDIEMASDYLSFWITFPEITLAHDFSVLQLAILERSYDRLTGLWTRYSSHDQSNSPWELTYLAIGWPEGLEFLVSNGCSILQAWQVTCYRKDLASASMLLELNPTRLLEQVFLSLSPRNSLGISMLATASLCKPAFRLLIKKLRELLSNRTGRVGKDDIPSTASEAGAYRMFSPHCIRDLVRRAPAVMSRKDSWSLCDIVYAEGFTDLAQPCHHGLTPVQELCERMGSGSWPHLWHRVSTYLSWYLSKGASPLLGVVKPHELLLWPHAAFYVFWQIRFEFQGFFFEYPKELFESIVKDGCCCLCSVGGCTPAMVMWRLPAPCHTVWYNRKPCCSARLVLRPAILRYYLRMSEVTRLKLEACYYAIARLEIFDRLGLKHTCCYTQEPIWRRSSPPEAAPQSSSDVKVAQGWLQRLLMQYRNLRSVFCLWPIRKFWGLWWKLVDVHLPPLPNQCIDDCRFYKEWQRHAKDKSGSDIQCPPRMNRSPASQATERKSIYVKQIMWDDLRRCLHRAADWKQSKRLWRTGRLMSKPKMRFLKVAQLNRLRLSNEAAWEGV